MKTQDGEDAWSPLSNLVSFQDSGFRFDRDGYRFFNAAIEPSNAPFTLDDLRWIRGDEYVCRTTTPECVPRLEREEYVAWVNETLLPKGYCFGFSITAMRFFTGLDEPGDLQPGAATPFDLRKTTDAVRHNFAFYQTLQNLYPFRLHREIPWPATPAQVLAEVEAALEAPLDDPPEMGVCPNDDYEACHNVLPYAISRDENGRWSDDLARVYVYDSSILRNAMVGYEQGYFVFHPTEWDYIVENADPINYVDLFWHGTVIRTARLSDYDQEPPPDLSYPPHERVTADAGPDATLRVLMAGDGGHLLIRDSQGRRLGFEGADFVDEMPGASASVMAGGLGSIEPLYVLLLTETYTLQLDGATLTETETVGVAQFGPDYAAWVKGVALRPGAQDQFAVAGDGTRVAFRPAGAQEAWLGQALDGVERSYRFELAGVDVGAGQAVTVTAVVTDGLLIFDSAETGGGAYDLALTRVTVTATQPYYHSHIPIQATDRHLIDFGAWDGLGPLTVYVDAGSDGSVDDTWVLANYQYFVYLPVVIRED
jgi:hypothetical protein